MWRTETIEAAAHAAEPGRRARRAAAAARVRTDAQKQHAEERQRAVADAASRVAEAESAKAAAQALLIEATSQVRKRVEACASMQKHAHAIPIVLGGSRPRFTRLGFTAARREGAATLGCGPRCAAGCAREAAAGGGPRARRDAARRPRDTRPCPAAGRSRARRGTARSPRSASGRSRII